MKKNGTHKVSPGYRQGNSPSPAEKLCGLEEPLRRMEWPRFSAKADKKSKKLYQSNQGLSLLEILVATIILGIIAYAGFSGLLAFKSRAADRTREYLAAQMARKKMIDIQKDFKSGTNPTAGIFCPTGINDCNGDGITDTIDPNLNPLTDANAIMTVGVKGGVFHGPDAPIVTVNVSYDLRQGGGRYEQMVAAFFTRG